MIQEYNLISIGAARTGHLQEIFFLQAFQVESMKREARGLSGAKLPTWKAFRLKSLKSEHPLYQFRTL
jgi:hypothetical protein